ncbi:FAD-dependent oxidoreductase [Rhodococcus cercidiphylli]|uniref:FAD-dependent oxidoreductase n=1 Tax=Rhodococcus cercidiphylli TaxID=489916 RepID=A0ABU4AWI2_9NOCA|nr:FAD-dependent oxidoreductase [Rhodococcus cercidiphylli]MDV6230601.1 FAD-dependent oxidoreductase [Rhodococcus cercidiphylli]
MDAPRRIVIVGASLAGLRAAETARAAGYDGTLVLVGAETHLPYDRPPLSKAFLAGEGPSDEPFFDGVDALADGLDIELVLGQPASYLDTQSRQVGVGDTAISYDAVLLATGSTARRLKGTDHLAGVVTLRTLDDARAIAAGLRAGSRTVVIGGGFIGSEVASAARDHGSAAVIVEAAPVPLVRAVGQMAGAWLSSLHGRNGTQLICGTAVESVIGSDRVEGVRLADGRVLEADMVVAGIGADPTTGWLKGSGLTLDNGVRCDSTLRAGEHEWAAGDVSQWWSEDFDRHLRIEHWTNAAEQGARAMRNLLDPDKAEPYRHIPYFWSDWYGHRIQLVGLPVGDPTVVTGSADSDKLVALYREGNRLAGALALNKRSDIMKYRALIARRADYSDGLSLAEQRNAKASGT